MENMVNDLMSDGHSFDLTNKYLTNIVDNVIMIIIST